jgi:hypothetical protein
VFCYPDSFNTYTKIGSGALMKIKFARDGNSLIASLTGFCASHNGKWTKQVMCRHQLVILSLILTLQQPAIAESFIFGDIDGIPMVIEAYDLVRPDKKAGWVQSIGCSRKKVPGFHGLEALIDFQARNIAFTKGGSDRPIYSSSIELTPGDWHGVKIIGIQSRISAAGRSRKLVGKMSIDPLNNFRLFRSCPDAGWEPGSLHALISPLEKQTALNWLRSKGINSSFVILDTGGETETGETETNDLWIAAPVGLEYELMAELRQQAWLLDVTRDATREARRAGPDDVDVTFPFRSILKPGLSPIELRPKVKTLVHGLVAAANARIDTEESGTGFSYSFIVRSPVSPFGIPKFEGWWTQFRINLLFDKVMEPDQKPVDRVIVQIAAGYLAKWPETSKTPPPPSRFNHLSPEGGTRFKDFTFLVELQKKIQRRLATLLAAPISNHAKVCRS